MSIEYASTWLDDVRNSNWYRRFSAKDPSKLGEGTAEERWEYLDDEGNQLYTNKAEEILAVNAPFLEYFSEPYVTQAIYDFAQNNLDDPTNGAHSRAAVGDQDADVLTVEQGMHQPEDNEDDEGFCLHVTVRLTSTSTDGDQGSVGQPRHAYMMQANDGSIYITSMT